MSDTESAPKAPKGFPSGPLHVVAMGGGTGLSALLHGLKQYVPAHGLLRGQVGTVVELLDGAYEVEFSDDEGKTYAELALAPDQLLVLRHRPHQAA